MKNIPKANLNLNQHLTVRTALVCAQHSAQLYNTIQYARSSADAERPHDMPQIQNITLEKAAIGE